MSKVALFLLINKICDIQTRFKQLQLHISSALGEKKTYGVEQKT